MGFDPGSKYYGSSDNGGGISGQDCIMITFTPESSDSSWLGSSEHNGATKAFAKVKEGLNEENLYKKTQAWQKVATVHAGYDTDLRNAAKAIFETPGVWEGDDADAALKIFNGTLASSSALKNYTQNMSDNVGTMHAAVQTAKGVSSNGGDAGFAGTGWGSSDGDGSKDTQAYMALAGDIDTSRQKMPTKIEYQNKPDGTDKTKLGTQVPGGPGGLTGTGAGVGGASTSSHVASPDLTHIGTTSHPGTNPGTNPGTDPGAGIDPGTGSVDPGLHEPPYTYHSSDPSLQSGAPTLDSGSTLAGYNPGTAGFGGGSAGAGAGFGGAGSVGGLGAGGSLSGASGLSGIGAGGLGAGSGAGGAGLGASAADGALAAEAAGAGAAGRGTGGMMMPMRGGGGGGGDDDERERSTWLTEDDDVWGTDAAAPPSTIS